MVRYFSFDKGMKIFYNSINIIVKSFIIVMLYFKAKRQEIENAP